LRLRHQSFCVDPHLCQRACAISGDSFSSWVTLVVLSQETFSVPERDSLVEHLHFHSNLRRSQKSRSSLNCARLNGDFPDSAYRAVKFWTQHDLESRFPCGGVVLLRGSRLWARSVINPFQWPCSLILRSGSTRTSLSSKLNRFCLSKTILAFGKGTVVYTAEQKDIVRNHPVVEICSRHSQYVSAVIQMH
jgi:hypothetical protein